MGLETGFGVSQHIPPVPPPGPPFVPTSARNGLSVDAGGRIVFGNDVGAVLANLLNDREVPMNGNNIFFKNALAPVKGHIILNSNTDNGNVLQVGGNVSQDGTSYFFNASNLSSIVQMFRRTVAGTSATRMLYMNPGRFNTYIGDGAGGLTPDAPVSNTVVGFAAMQSVLGGAGNNTAMGINNLRFTTTGNANSTFGLNCGILNTTGNENTYVGEQNGFNNTTQSNNTLVGARVLTSSGLSQNSNGCLSVNTIGLGYAAGSGGLIFAGAATLITDCIFVGNNNGITVEGTNLTNTGIIGNGITTILNNIFAIARADQNALVGFTAALVDTGDRLQVNGGIAINNPAFMLKSTTAMTNGAAAAVGTLLNAPVAGDPTKWIAFNDNGTVRQIPCW